MLLVLRGHRKQHSRGGYHKQRLQGGRRKQRSSIVSLHASFPTFSIPIPSPSSLCIGDPLFAHRLSSDEMLLPRKIGVLPSLNTDLIAFAGSFYSRSNVRLRQELLESSPKIVITIIREIVRVISFVDFFHGQFCFPTLQKSFRAVFSPKRSQTLSHFSFLSSTIPSRHDTKWSDPFRCSPARNEGKKLSLFLCDSSSVTSTETIPLLRGPGSHFAFFLRAVEAPRPLLTQTLAPSSLVDFRFRGSDRRRCVSSPSSVRVWVANSSVELSMERFWLNLNPFRFRLLRALLFGKGLLNLTTRAHSHPTPAKISLPQALSAYVSFVVLEPDPTSTGIMGFARFVNVGDERGETPLHLAAQRRWTECVSVLLDHGVLFLLPLGNMVILGALLYIWQLAEEVWIVFAHCLHGEPIGSRGIHLGGHISSFQIAYTLGEIGTASFTIEILNKQTVRIPYSIAIKHNHGACAALLNPSAAEPLVWPSPLKFISELDPNARALLEVALMDANKESEKIILNERKKLLSPANVDEAFHDDASEILRHHRGFGELYGILIVISLVEHICLTMDNGALFA
ncbi:hypothetical protein ZIOFF_072776 [Zingiber officinale]|uniref:Uncharacterized protein n=1 Tax=Zingiber officinale TaxID=94328 RepID=A0A8J5BB71_ZINOF|nr:hypothetical protein ZIOFF_072776 [Zingiber officinale]